MNDSHTLKNAQTDLIQNDVAYITDYIYFMNIFVKLQDYIALAANKINVYSLLEHRQYQPDATAHYQSELN